jgi:sugar phosphate permease
MSPEQSQPRRASLGLDAANFFLADVRDGLGPYLSIYLLTVKKWDAASIGIVMSIAAVAGIVAQTPIGALVDASRAKRLLSVAGALAVTLASVLLPFLQSFWPVAISQGIAGTAAVIFPPALSAITIGIYGNKGFTARIGRNESFNHAGNAFAAAAAGTIGYFFGPVVVFFLLAAMAMFSVASILFVPSKAIDYDRARGLAKVNKRTSAKSGTDPMPSGLSVIIRPDPCSFSPRAPSCSILPMPPCCPWSGRCWH